MYGNHTKLVIIKDKSIISLILHSYADEDKKKILNITANKPRIILDIISVSKLPQTSSYRKINSLIKNDISVKAKFSEDACQAVFRMMRTKIINFKKENISNSKSYNAVGTESVIISSNSMIPFLIKNGVIKV